MLQCSRLYWAIDFRISYFRCEAAPFRLFPFIHFSPLLSRTLDVYNDIILRSAQPFRNYSSRGIFSSFGLVVQWNIFDYSVHTVCERYIGLLRTLINKIFSINKAREHQSAPIFQRNLFKLASVICETCKTQSRHCFSSSLPPPNALSSGQFWWSCHRQTLISGKIIFLLLIWLLTWKMMKQNDMLLEG